MFDDRRLGLNTDPLQPVTPFEPAPEATTPLSSAAARLGSLRGGDVATIAGVDSSQLAAKRLADMGFIPGVQVEMLRPGKPCLVRVNGICLGLGLGHQESILLGESA